MKITKTQLKQIIQEELSNIVEGGPPSMGQYTGPEKEMYDVLKGERPPPQARDVASLMPIDNTEASMTPNYEREVEQLVYDMTSSGMGKEQIMAMVEQSLDFLMK